MSIIMIIIISNLSIFLTCIVHTYNIYYNVVPVLDVVIVTVTTRISWHEM